MGGSFEGPYAILKARGRAIDYKFGLYTCVYSGVFATPAFLPALMLFVILNYLILHGKKGPGKSSAIMAAKLAKISRVVRIVDITASIASAHPPAASRGRSRGEQPAFKFIIFWTLPTLILAPQKKRH